MSLVHPNITSATSLGVAFGRLFFTAKLVVGEPGLFAIERETSWDPNSPSGSSYSFVPSYPRRMIAEGTGIAFSFPQFVATRLDGFSAKKGWSLDGSTGDDEAGWIWMFG